MSPDRLASVSRLEMSLEKRKSSSCSSLACQSRSQRFSYMEDCTYDVTDSGTSSPKTKSLKRKISHEEMPPKKRSRVGEVLPELGPCVDKDADGPSSIKRSHADETSVWQREFLGSASSSTSSLMLSDSSSQDSLTAEENEGPTENQLAQQIRDENIRAAFNSKYRQMNPLQKGGYGQVFAGLRRADDLPVALKYIPKEKVEYEQIGQTENKVPSEVDIMQKLTVQRDGSEAVSAPVALMDWYDLEDELILVIERPVPCMDLVDYAHQQKGLVTEEEAQVIVKQALEAFDELDQRCVFHGDIKMENILIETRGDVPRVRIIDFGQSAIVGREHILDFFKGTPCHLPPEYVLEGLHAAGTTTVWQLGILVYDILHKYTQFETLAFIENTQEVRLTLSQDCLDFLEKCLTIRPEERPTLQELLEHPWMQ